MGNVTGTLGLFSLVDLFQLLTASKRTGRLVVDHPSGIARVYFDKGAIVHAEFGELTGENAVYALFLDEQGAFEFRLGLPAPARTVETSTENLILEAIRRLDEGRRDETDSAAPVDDEVVPSFASDAAEAGNLTLQLSEIQVLRHVDGKRNVRQLAQAAGVDVASARRIVGRLLRIGALTAQTQRPRVARLVAQLASGALGAGQVGIDETILANWQRVIGKVPEWVACKRPSGRVDLYRAEAIPEAGPYILFSRDTLLATDLSVDTTLLVKPWEPPAPN